MEKIMRFYTICENIQYGLKIEYGKLQYILK